MIASGFLVLDKPSGITSRDAVDHAQHWFPKVRLGHAGTLDPAATGVLVLGVGPAATRLIEYVQQQEKVYRSTFVLGATSTTDDGDGNVTPQPLAIPPDQVAVETALRQFVGRFSQTPPAYSAALVQGQRAYSKARRGEEVVLAPRPVEVYRIDLLRYDYPQLDVEILCGKGTYIRSIARDLGAALQTGGYVSQLRRTRVGGFTMELVVPWDAASDEALARVQPLLSAVAGLPRVIATGEEVARLRLGQWLRGERSIENTGHVAILCGGALVGIGAYDPAQRVLRPTKMLQAP